MTRADKISAFVYTNTMNKRSFMFFTVSLSLLMVFNYSPVAEGSPKNEPNSVRLKKEELLCGQIQDKIKNKQEIRKIVKAGIQMGYNACAIIKCSIKGGGELKQVITGAVEAGTTKDVVSRCSVDAGADAREVAAILNGLSDPGICYVLPEEMEDIDPPPGGTDGGYLSPSGF